MLVKPNEQHMDSRPTCSVDEVKQMQQELSFKVEYTDPSWIDTTKIAGIDIAYSGQTASTCVAVLRASDLALLRTENMTSEVDYPYVPGLLALREAPLMSKILQGMNLKCPVLVDGNGVLHPRGFGLACSVGFGLGITTIGVAKKLLLGEVGLRERDIAPITHEGRTVGAAVWLGNSSKPVYVSVGHKISLPTAVKVVIQSSWSRNPEPLRQAHMKARAHLAVA